MSIGCDNPKLILPVVRFDTVPVGPSSHVARAAYCSDLTGGSVKMVGSMRAAAVSITDVF
jgi:hypothetical protein